MRNRARIVLVAGLLACATACHKDQKAEQLQALETAYRSGVFTREEYESKKAALVGSTPLASVPTSTTPDSAVPIPDPSAAPPGLNASTQPVASPPSTSAPAPIVNTPSSPPQVSKPLSKPAPVVSPPTSRPRPEPPPQPYVSPGPPLSAGPPPGNPPPQRPAPREDAPSPRSATCGAAEPGGPAIQASFYDAAVEATERAAIAALESLDFEIKQRSRSGIEATKRRHLSAVVGAGGEKVTLRFENTERGTRVTGETKKSFMGKLAQKSWSRAVLAQIACHLKR